MNDLELMKEREKVFEQYRQINQEFENLNRAWKVKSQELENVRSQLSKLRSSQQYFEALIKIMITEDCDPVEAKLKYDEELEATKNMPEQAEAMALDTITYTPKQHFRTRYGKI